MGDGSDWEVLSLSDLTCRIKRQLLPSEVTLSKGVCTCSRRNEESSRSHAAEGRGSVLTALGALPVSRFLVIPSRVQRFFLSLIKITLALK